MKRALAGLAGLLVTAALAGCGSSTPTTACTPRGNDFVICLNGKPIDFSAAKVGPHMHETGNIYAPVLELAQALHVPVQVDAPHQVVIVNGQQVKATTGQTPKGIHLHGDEVFVPIREFAQAAGLTVELRADGHTAGFAK